MCLKEIILKTDLRTCRPRAVLVTVMEKKQDLDMQRWWAGYRNVTVAFDGRVHRYFKIFTKTIK